MASRRDGAALRYLSTLFHVGTVVGLTDGQLLERFVTTSGETANSAFAALIERHGPMVLRVCRGVLRDEHEAHDAFQATFLVLLRRAGSLWVRGSLGPWLYRVGYRVAVRAKVASDRREEAERRAAEMAGDRASDGQGDDLGPILYEEIDRLPGRYRVPVILCDLEGRTYEEAARHQGCPVGTLKSRLARGRDRLRSKLIRRGLAPAIGAPGMFHSAEAALATVPPALIVSTLQVAMRFAAGSAATGGLVPPTIAALTKGALNAMIRTKVRTSVLALLAIATAAGVGLLMHGILRANATPPGAGDVRVTALAPRGSVRHIDRLDLGQLHVGALAEAQFSVIFSGADDADLSVRVEPPEFVELKGLRVWKRGDEQPGVTACSVQLSLDTKAAGKRSGDLRVRLGEQIATIPVVASVVPEERGMTKVLVVSSDFGGASDESAYYRPWFDLINAERLDVSYMESFGGLQFTAQGAPGGPPLVPEELARYDVILLAEGGTVFLNEGAAGHLRRFVESGKRLIVTASPAFVGAVLKANLILDPFGIHMKNEEPRREPGMDRIDVDDVDRDPLTKGVKTLSFFRPAPIQVAGEKAAKVLAFEPGSKDGLVAISRQRKGEVVAIGLTLVSSWIGEQGKGSDNAQLLRNLLTMDSK